MTNAKKTAKPFLKWAGGKSQLMPQIARCFPYKKDEPFTFIEPFIGSGAVLFWVLEHFPLVERVIINDLNTDLINTYKAVALAVDDLVWVLKHWEKEFHGLASDHAAKQTYYYEKRAFFNERSADGITHAALFIFLNRTCYNGLYRVNRHNTICDEANLHRVNKALEKVKILNGDFEETLDFANNSTFFYFDPPYKPINTTSSFNAYASSGFDDEEQTRLKNFCDKIHAKGHNWMLSNSDVKVTENASPFFDDLYADYHIERVKARRAINSVASKRGELNELLITNYRY